MSDALAPYTAVLVASYGGPNKSEDVLPFMRNATAGRGIPDERLLEVSEHYEMFGGKSPINERNAELLDALRAELRSRGVDVPVVIGNRNWHPFHEETAPALVADGHTRVVALATSAYHSYSSCRQYSEDLERASACVDGALQLDKVRPFAETDAFVTANARAVVEAWNSLRDRIGDARAKLLFVTHSIPDSMNALSGDGSPGCTYREQHLRVAERVTAAACAQLGEPLQWELTYCSRSGPPHIPWLEPDISDRLVQLRADGVSGVVASPIGFITDHMEVVYDLDTEAAQTADEQGLAFERAATVGVDPDFVSMLVDELFDQAAVARGELIREVRPCCFAPARRPTRQEA